MSDLLGRKPSLMLSGVPALIGWLMIALAHMVPSGVQGFYGVLLSGRIMTGVYLGWSVVGVSVSSLKLVCIHIINIIIIYYNIAIIL